MILKKMTINAILDYIEDNIEISPIDINSLVEYSGYSRRYLQLLFFDYIGMPVGKYIQRRRVSRAAVLLRLTNLPLVTISEKLCYDSQQHSLANSRSIPVTPHSNTGKIKYGHLKTRRVTDIWILCFQFRNSGAWKTRISLVLLFALKKKSRIPLKILSKSGIWLNHYFHAVTNRCLFQTPLARKINLMTILL